MGDKTVCLLPALLLLTVPGVNMGPGTVSGRERGSLTVRCHYGPGWETHRKWWCRGSGWYSCVVLAQTTGSEQEVKKGRVSIRDHQKRRMFTVTVEDLRLDDADTYWCGVEEVGVDPKIQVQVAVLPATTVFIVTTSTSTTNTTVITTTTAAPRAQVTPGESKVPPTPSNTSSLLGTVHLLLPVFLKLPLLPSVLSAVLRLSRSQGVQRHAEPVTPRSSLLPGGNV